MTTISMIAAIDNNRGIGKDNKLLWHIPEDLKRFKKLTSGHPIIMGYNTYLSIGKSLPNRVNIILSRKKFLTINEVIVKSSIEDAIETACQIDKNEIFIIGGGQVYKQAIKYSAKLYLTLVNDICEADTYFPDYSDFTIISREDIKSNKLYNFSFLVLKKNL